MQDWLKAQLASGFADFSGATLSGVIPVKDSLVNEWIAEFLAAAREPSAAAPSFDARPLATLVHSATIQAEPGVITVRVALKV